MDLVDAGTVIRYWFSFIHCKSCLIWLPLSQGPNVFFPCDGNVLVRGSNSDLQQAVLMHKIIFIILF